MIVELHRTNPKDSNVYRNINSIINTIPLGSHNAFDSNPKGCNDYSDEEKK